MKIFFLIVLITFTVLSAQEQSIDLSLKESLNAEQQKQRREIDRLKKQIKQQKDMIDKLTDSLTTLNNKLSTALSIANSAKKTADSSLKLTKKTEKSVMSAHKKLEWEEKSILQKHIQNIESGEYKFEKIRVKHIYPYTPYKNNAGSIYTTGGIHIHGFIHHHKSRFFIYGPLKPDYYWFVRGDKKKYRGKQYEHFFGFRQGDDGVVVEIHNKK